MGRGLGRGFGLWLGLGLGLGFGLGAMAGVAGWGLGVGGWGWGWGSHREGAVALPPLLDHVVHLAPGLVLDRAQYLVGGRGGV